MKNTIKILSLCVLMMFVFTSVSFAISESEIEPNSIFEAKDKVVFSTEKDFSFLSKQLAKIKLGCTIADICAQAISDADAALDEAITICAAAGILSQACKDAKASAKAAQGTAIEICSIQYL